MYTTLLLVGIVFLVVGLFFTVAFFILEFPLVFRLFPLIFVLLGGGLVFVAARKKLTRKKLVENGSKVWATVTEVTPNYSVTINGRHPYILICSADGTLYQGEYNKTGAVNLVGKTVPVYISREDPDEYYVDTGSL